MARRPQGPAGEGGEANTQFFTLRGSVWDVQNVDNSLITSDESGALPPPRNWLGINDVYLVT